MTSDRPHSDPVHPRPARRGGPGFAVEVELTPYIGYRFSLGFEDEETGDDLQFADSALYGLALDFAIDQNSQVEVFWSRQDTSLERDGGLFQRTTLFDVTIDYLQVGGVYTWDGHGRVRGLVSGTLGIVHLSPEAAGLSSETRFAMTFSGGANIRLSDHVGLRFDGRMSLMFMSSSGGFFCSGGCVVVVNSSILAQVEATGGVSFMF